MKVSKLKHIIREEILRELQYPKNKYIEVTDPSEIDELKDTLFKLIQTAYAPIGGHVKFKSPSDVLDPGLKYWKVAEDLGFNQFIRANTVQAHPLFIDCLKELVLENCH